MYLIQSFKVIMPAKQPKAAFLKVFRWGPIARLSAGLGRPALTNLGRRKPREAGNEVYGESDFAPLICPDSQLSMYKSWTRIALHWNTVRGSGSCLEPVILRQFRVDLKDRHITMPFQNAGLIRVSFNGLFECLIMRHAFWAGRVFGAVGLA